MLLDPIFSIAGSVAQEISAALSFRIAARVRIRNRAGLQLVLQFLVFALLIVPCFIGLLYLLVWGLFCFL